MSWYLHRSDSVSVVEDFLNFNRIPWHDANLWSDDNCHRIPDNLCEATKSVLVLTGGVLRDLVLNPNEVKKLRAFAQRDNHVWIWDNSDGFTQLLTFPTIIETLCQDLGKDSVWVFLDAEPLPGHWVTNTANLVTKIMPVNWFMRVPRLLGAVDHRVKPSRDFVVTMISKPERPHREMLWRELQSRPGLLDRAHAKYHNRRDGWLGDLPHHHTWADGHPSMDLYRDSWLELVPETLHDHGYFVTEKTIKPLATHTPFLIASTPGYLGHLHELGFQTFDHVIDEDYDNEVDLGRRMRRIVDVLEHVVANGAEDFYHACGARTEHNFRRLCEISGGWQNSMDRFLAQCASAVDQ